MLKKGKGGYKPKLEQTPERIFFNESMRLLANYKRGNITQEEYIMYKAEAKINMIRAKKGLNNINIIDEEDQHNDLYDEDKKDGEENIKKYILNLKSKYSEAQIKEIRTNSNKLFSIKIKGENKQND